MFKSDYYFKRQKSWLLLILLGIRLDPPGWWSNDTYIEYDKRAQCVVNTYESLEVVELPYGPKINGTLTLGENIADIGGNRLAYYAYRKYTNHDIRQ